MSNAKRVLAALAAAAAVSGCGFQSIPQSENAVTAAWGEVQNQYQRRADLVPNLVETVKGYATHERETLEGVMEARAKATQVQLNANDLTPENLKKFEDAQAGLRSALGRLMVVAENYPQLRANQNFLSLQDQLEGTENRIAVARNRSSRPCRTTTTSSPCRPPASRTRSSITSSRSRSSPPPPPAPSRRPR